MSADVSLLSQEGHHVDVVIKEGMNAAPWRVPFVYCDLVLKTKNYVGLVREFMWCLVRTLVAFRRFQ